MLSVPEAAFEEASIARVFVVFVLLHSVGFILLPLLVVVEALALWKQFGTGYEDVGHIAYLDMCVREKSSWAALVWRVLTHHIGGGRYILDDNTAVGTCLASLVANEPGAEALDTLDVGRCGGIRAWLTV